MANPLSGNLTGPLRTGVIALIGLASIFVCVLGCGPTKESRESGGSQNANPLVGIWTISVGGKSAGTLKLGERSFSVVQSDPADHSLTVTLEGSYELAGQALTRVVEKASVVGGAPANNAAVRQNAASIVEKPLHASIEWLGRDQFKLRDESGAISLYTRRAGD